MISNWFPLKNWIEAILIHTLYDAALGARNDVGHIFKFLGPGDITSPLAYTETRDIQTDELPLPCKIAASRKQMTFRAYFNGVKRRAFLTQECSLGVKFKWQAIKYAIIDTITSNKYIERSDSHHPIQKLNFNPETKIRKVARLASLVNVSNFAIKSNQTSSELARKSHPEPPKVSRLATPHVESGRLIHDAPHNKKEGPAFKRY